MDKLTSVFLTEAKEMCVQLEKDMLELEKDYQNSESISSVFRAMHTLKGSAAMFGFEVISILTHHLETIYESIRDGRRELTPDILSTTFKSLDHLHALMEDPQMVNAETREINELLVSEIKVLESNTDFVQRISATKQAEQKEFTYYVYIIPVGEIFRKGTNTLYLIDDLLTLGQGIALPFFNDLPSLATIVPDYSYTGFEVILSTLKNEEDIKAVFMFVEGECEVVVTKVAEDNLLKNDKVVTQLTTLQKSYVVKGFEKIKNILMPPTVASRVKTLSESVQSNKGTGSSIRVSSERLDELMNLVSELVTTQAQLSLLADNSNVAELTLVAENVEKITRRLRDNAFSVSLIPIESLVVKFQRLVRDLSKELNKEIVFKAEGTSTEIDKSIIEKLSDPLLHILRNAMDHGIEDPDVREKKGKPRQGTVLLKSYYSGANVIIEIIDDGAGINLERVRDKAISKGLISADVVLSEKELTNLIFLPGFSTAEKVTGVSGRGVGMDVVMRNISDLRGEIEITTREEQGSSFIIKLPLTLSIIDGLLVEIGDTRFILPLSSVSKCYEVETIQLQTTFNQWITLDGERTPFLFLRDEFHIEIEAPQHSQIINVNHNGNFIGIAVDRIIGQYQAVLKPLGQMFRQQDEFSGATILGDGTVALVIDTNRLSRKLIAIQEEEKYKIKIKMS
jgi:two-component system chemotaxis sensor kinase CheA